MRSTGCVGWLFGLAGVLLYSCQSGDLDVGQAVINPNELQVQSVDSVSIQTATVVVTDSFITSTDSSILVGQWTDAQTGRLLARGFTSVDYPTNDLAAQTGLRLDSLVLELGYSFAYGDTTTAMTLSVHQLRQPLATNVYYNTSAANYDASPLLQKTVVPRPNSGTRFIRFRMPDDVTQAFWSSLLGGTISDATTLAEYWRGFAFTGQSATNRFVGFSAGTASGLRLYYHATDIDRTASSLRFPLSAAHFSQLLNDRSGTVLQALQQRTDAVSSEQTDHTTFMALGAGLRTRIEFPFLGQFDRPERFAGLNTAILVIEPVRHDQRDNSPPPAQLTLYTLNNQNEILGAVAAGATGATQAVASYAYDPNALELTDAYAFDLTQYIGQVIRGQLPNRPLLLTVPLSQSDLRTLVQRVSLGDSQRSSDRMRLRLYITSGL